MECIYCGKDASDVTDSRKRNFIGIDTTYRRRECRICKKRFSTYEMPKALAEKQMANFMMYLVGSMKEYCSKKETCKRCAYKCLCKGIERLTLAPDDAEKLARYLMSTNRVEGQKRGRPCLEN